MNPATTIALITISSLSLIASGTTLAIVLIGSKKVQTEIDETKSKANDIIHSLVNALDRTL